MYAHHENKRARELAMAVLINVNDKEFLKVFENITTWVKSLDIEDDSNAAKKLTKNNIGFHQFIVSSISLDIIALLLKGLDLNAGTVLAMLCSISNVRKQNELAFKKSLDLANGIKINERKIAVTHNKLEDIYSIDKTKKKYIY